MTIPDLTRCVSGDPDAIPADWQAEIKHDGVRVLAYDGALFTRTGTDITRKVPEIDTPHPGVAIDGELLPVGNGAGLADVQRRIQTTSEFRIEVLSRTVPLQVIAFDVLIHDGEDIRHRPLVDRQGRLLDAVKAFEGWGAVEPFRDPEWLWSEANAEGWEGIVVKDPEAPYPGEESDRWLRFKTWEDGTFPVVDFEATDNGGFVVYADIGADEPQKVAANGAADRRAIEAGADAIEVQYLERSKNDRLRKPSLKRVVD